ncbi:hypothetical protein THAOC_25407 [Thalassiosira oceanica]|uniref:Uncharacterized protein n=1 Tax=Thalassiosira oceanica TaxID=159749 RepID=K0RP92_THAOC|nr:hypothetical protein THAOC_25407 [Thalassiosira oceanica]|eukprot:EJK54920.1 hypothetical protein THAOC_25407 [Thalassiosira oceanica]
MGHENASSLSSSVDDILCPFFFPCIQIEKLQGFRRRQATDRQHASAFREQRIASPASAAMYHQVNKATKFCLSVCLSVCPSLQAFSYCTF